MNNVYITAYTSLSSLGIGNEQSINTMAEEKSTIHFPTKDEKFKKPSFPVSQDLGINDDITLSAKFTIKLLSMLEEAWIGLAPLPIFLATSTGGIKETEEVYTQLIHTGNKYPLAQKHYFYDIFETIKAKYGDKIPEAYTFSTACSSAGHSILHAYRFIKNGIIDRALVLGVDALSITTQFGFDALKLVSPGGTNPLTKERDGLSLGEGGAVILLESQPATEPVAEIMGVHSTTDGYHITAPNPQGTQQKACMIKSIEMSGVPLEKIDYVNAHGTGTPANDEVEFNVVKSIFPHAITMSSLKGFIGHTVGSSAIIELALALEMLKRNKIYQPVNMGTPIDEAYIPQKTIDKKVTYFLKNSFGFGGNNVSFVIRNNF